MIISRFVWNTKSELSQKTLVYVGGPPPFSIDLGTLQLHEDTPHNAILFAIVKLLTRIPTTFHPAAPKMRIPLTLINLNV